MSRYTHLFKDGKLSYRSQKEVNKQKEQYRQLEELKKIADMQKLKLAPQITYIPPPISHIPRAITHIPPVINPMHLHTWTNYRVANSGDAFVKYKIEQIFDSNDNWKVIDPPGDGFCGLHAINIARQLLPNHLVSNITEYCPKKEKDLIINYIIDGITEYRRVLFKIHKDLKNHQINNIIKNKIRPLLDSMSKEPTTAIDDSDEMFGINMITDFENDKLKQAKIDTIKLLIDKGDVEALFLQFLAYKFKHSFIFLFYERRGNTSRRCTYGDIKYNDYTINNQANTIEKIADNTSIIFNDGHYVLFYNEDKQKELSLIAALRNNNNGETFWQSNNRQLTFQHTPDLVQHTPDFVTRLKSQFKGFLGYGKRRTLRQRQQQKQRHTLRRKQLKRHTLRRKQLKRQTLKNRKKK